MAPDFNLCVDLGTPTLTIFSVTSRSDSPWPLTHTDVNANCTYGIHASRHLLKLKWPRIWVTSWPRRGKEEEEDDEEKEEFEEEEKEEEEEEDERSGRGGRDLRPRRWRRGCGQTDFRKLLTTRDLPG